MLTHKLSGHTINTMRFSNSLITRPRAAEVLAKVEITLMFLPHNPLHIITKTITSTLLAEPPIRTDRTIVALLGETKEGTITNIITPTTTITQDTIVEEIIKCNIWMVITLNKPSQGVLIVHRSSSSFSTILPINITNLSQGTRVVLTPHLATKEAIRNMVGKSAWIIIKAATRSLISNSSRRITWMEAVATRTSSTNSNLTNNNGKTATCNTARWKVANITIDSRDSNSNTLATIIRAGTRRARACTATNSTLADTTNRGHIMIIASRWAIIIEAAGSRTTPIRAITTTVGNKGVRVLEIIAVVAKWAIKRISNSEGTTNTMTLSPSMTTQTHITIKNSTLNSSIRTKRRRHLNNRS